MSHTVNYDGKIRTYPHISRVHSIRDVSAKFYLIMAQVEDGYELWQSDIEGGHLVVEHYYRELYGFTHNVPTITITHMAETSPRINYSPAV